MTDQTATEAPTTIQALAQQLIRQSLTSCGQMPTKMEIDRDALLAIDEDARKTLSPERYEAMRAFAADQGGTLLCCGVLIYGK